MFYCTAHDVMEDSDFVGYQVTEAGEEVCDEAGDEEDEPFSAQEFALAESLVAHVEVDIESDRLPDDFELP